LSGIGDAYTIVDAKREIFSPACAWLNVRNVVRKLARRSFTG
jgi:hypothetical protein